MLFVRYVVSYVTLFVVFVVTLFVRELYDSL